MVIMDNSETYCLKVNTLILGDLVVGDVSELKNGMATYGDALRSMFQILDFTASLPQMTLQVSIQFILCLPHTML